MSEYLPERNVGPEPPRYAAERDVGPYGKLALVGAAVLAVFALSVFLMWRWEVASRAALAPPAVVPDTIGSAQINGVNQTMFDVEDGAHRARRDDQRWLKGYGWVDADAGVAHIPVEEAMTLVLAGASGTSSADGQAAPDAGPADAGSGARRSPDAGPADAGSGARRPPGKRPAEGGTR